MAESSRGVRRPVNILMWSFILILSAVMVMPAFVRADTTTQRLDDLVKRIDLMEQTYLTNNQGIASAVARAESLTRDAAEIRGAIEANEHLIVSDRRESQKIYLDLEHRLQALEERMQILAGQMSEALRKVDVKSADEGDLYRAGLDKIQNNNALEAISKFTVFLKKYPKSTFAPLAQYWIAESYFSLRDWQRAIKEYQKLIDKYSNHDKARLALVGQGRAFAELGMYDEAQVFFDKVIQTFPATSEAVRAQDERRKLDERRANITKEPSLPNVTTYPEQTVQEQRQQQDQILPSPDELTPSPPPSSPTPDASPSPDQQEPLEY